MKTFGLSADHLALLQRLLSKHLGQNQEAKVYLFGSRALGTFRKNSDIDLLLENTDPKSVDNLRASLEDSDLPFKADLVRKEDLLKEYRASVGKAKTLFWQGTPMANPWRVVAGKFQHHIDRHPLPN